MNSKKQAFIVSAMKSGSGKTLITLGLINILKRAGKSVSIYKTGPDYIDTMYHEKIAGSPSTNLDPYFLEPSFKPGELKKLFFRNLKGDVAIIEGAMGLFDGIYGEGKRCSACIVSEELNVDVIMVVDMDELDNLSAYLQSFTHRVKAVIVNKVKKYTDINMIRLRLNELGLFLIGYLYFDTDFHIESRHLGLYEPQKDIFNIVDKVSDELSKTLDFTMLEDFYVEVPHDTEVTTEVLNIKPGKYRLAFAYDEAFSFTYEENINVLEEYGFEIVKFSPVHDKKLPDNIDVLWLSGGYPELYARELSSNTSMLESIYNADIPIIAECGGFIYLHKSFENNEGESFKGVGLIAGKAFKTKKLVRFGYIEIEALSDSILIKRNQRIRSHEFHYYDSTCNGEYAHAIKANKSKEWDCINAHDNIFAGFPHIYLRGYEFLLQNLISFLERKKDV